MWYVNWHIEYVIDKMNLVWYTESKLDFRSEPYCNFSQVHYQSFSFDESPSSNLIAYHNDLYARKEFNPELLSWFNV